MFWFSFYWVERFFSKNIYFIFAFRIREIAFRWVLLFISLFIVSFYFLFFRFLYFYFLYFRDIFLGFIFFFFEREGLYLFSSSFIRASSLSFRLFFEGQSSRLFEIAASLSFFLRWEIEIFLFFERGLQRAVSYFFIEYFFSFLCFTFRERLLMSSELSSRWDERLSLSFFFESQAEAWLFIYLQFLRFLLLSSILRRDNFSSFIFMMRYLEFSIFFLFRVSPFSADSWAAQRIVFYWCFSVEYIERWFREAEIFPERLLSLREGRVSESFWEFSERVSLSWLNRAIYRDYWDFYLFSI